MGLTLTQAASGAPVTVDQVKVHCGIDSSEWDLMLEAFIAAATAHAEQFLNKAIGPQDWALSIDAFADEITLPLGPVTDVASIHYLDEDRVQQTLDEGVYILDLISTPQRIVRDPLESWPATADLPNAVTVAFTTGYETAPPQVVQAILLAVGNWWMNREAGAFPAAAEQLLRPLRRIVI